MKKKQRVNHKAYYEELEKIEEVIKTELFLPKLIPDKEFKIDECKRLIGLVEEYEIFMKICKRVRKMYLLAYSAINDKKTYEFVLNSCIYLVIVLIQRLNLNNTTLKED